MSVTKNISIILRLEGLLVLILSLLVYAQYGSGWTLFAILFLLPDLSLLAYFSGPRIGAAAYNAAHSYIGALLLVTWGFLLGGSLALALGIIWVAHIGFDRAMGYGLKSPEGFRFTHLGLIGQSR
ncbi:DUF4260 family protein [Saccharophagus sp. K07]|uniref:DUF4260 family protein n=1 Tax=Saccharophagus sp. K07 TaxID=2283636 RepID=UPI0016528172|nr:DUF4260 family protein [Saccharophagus sp. K07]MBC6906512.1 DUF4260 family protein [Saccharophagus sp. K07]